MIGNYQYTAGARWTRGRRGVASAETVEQPVEFASPPEFQGEAGLWTPEHFFVASVAACFVTTFLAIAELSKFTAVSLKVSATGTLAKGDGGFQFTRVTVKPVLEIEREADRERALRLLEKAEHSCLVTRSLRSEMDLEPTVVVHVSASVAEGEAQQRAGT